MEGKIRAKEGQKFKWVKLSDLKKYNLLRSNQKLIKFIFQLKIFISSMLLKLHRK